MNLWRDIYCLDNDKTRKWQISKNLFGYIELRQSLKFWLCTNAPNSRHIPELSSDSHLFITVQFLVCKVQRIQSVVWDYFACRKFIIEEKFRSESIWESYRIHFCIGLMPNLTEQIICRQDCHRTKCSEGPSIWESEENVSIPQPFSLKHCLVFRWINFTLCEDSLTTLITIMNDKKYYY